MRKLLALLALLFLSAGGAMAQSPQANYTVLNSGLFPQIFQSAASRLVPFSTAPFTCDVGGEGGFIYYNSTSKTPLFCNETGWIDLRTAATPPLSGVTAPTANTALSMGAFTVTMTWGATTGSSSLFRGTDTALNNGTGWLFDWGTAASSTLKPGRFCYRGTTDCVGMDTDTWKVFGAAQIRATQANDGTVFALSTPAVGQLLTINGSSQIANANAGTTIRTVSGTSDTILTADCVPAPKVIVYTGASPAIAVPQAGSAGFATGCTFTMKMAGTGAASVTTTTSTIDGVAGTVGMVLWPGAHGHQADTVTFISDGTNWITSGLVRPRLVYSTTCTAEANCTTQADTAGTGGNQDTASGTAGNSELFFKSQFAFPAGSLNVLGRGFTTCAGFSYITPGTALNQTIQLSFNTSGSVRIFTSVVTAAINTSSAERGFTLCSTAATSATGATGNLSTGGIVIPFGAGLGNSNSASMPTANIDLTAANTLLWSWLWSGTTATYSVKLISMQVWVN